jgi:DNA primase
MMESEMNISRIVALALYCGAVSFSSAALAVPEGDGAHGSRIERFCAKTPDPARREQHLARLAERLHLTDAQKDLFKAVQDARAAARKTAVDAICANQPDVHSFEGKLAFRQRLLEARLNGLKASSPKLITFYNALDNGQKALFDDLRRRQRHHWGHRHVGWEHGGHSDGRQEWRSRDD